MSIAEKLVIIAENEQWVYDKGREDGGNEAYPIGFAEGKQEGMEQGYREGFRFGREDGIEEGIEQGKQEELANCQAKHFVGTAMGDGTNSISFEVPFKPDTYLITAINPLATTISIAWYIITGETNNCQENIGVLRAVNDNATGFAGGSITNTLQLKNVTYKNGVFNYTEREYRYNFGKNITYTLIAFKTGITPKEYTIKQINELPDTSTGKVLQYNRTRINENFTTEEWESLIATKPNWTFSLV